MYATARLDPLKTPTWYRSYPHAQLTCKPGHQRAELNVELLLQYVETDGNHGIWRADLRHSCLIMLPDVAATRNQPSYSCTSGFSGILCGQAFKDVHGGVGRTP